MLAEAEDGDIQGAVAWYEGLINGLPPNDPSQGELNYWLGRARYAQGDAEGARKALRIALQYPTVETQARALIGQIDSEELQIHRLPLTMDFDTGSGHFLHSWRHGDKGSVARGLPPGEQDPALAWTTQVEEREDDAVVVWFAPDAPALTQVSFRIRSQEFPAAMVLLLEDTKGRRFAYPALLITSTTEWVSVDLLAQDFVPVDAGLEPLDTGDIRSLSFWDRTAFEASSRGQNVHYLDDFALR